MMFNKTNKVKIRLLPVFIFVAVLTVSVKLNNIFDLYNNPAQKTLSISPAQALAEEKANSDTAELSKVLNQGDKAARQRCGRNSCVRIYSVGNSYFAGIGRTS